MPDDDDEKGKPRNTFQGHASPEDGVRERPVFDDSTEVDDEQPSLRESGELYLPPGTVSRSIHAQTPLVEIEVVHQHGPAPRMNQPPHTVEVWTQNRIYTCDAQLNCVAVSDRVSGQADPAHPFLGHRLVGGQHREGETFEISHPFPRPGTEAVFEHPEGFARKFLPDIDS